jgi:hypothetical protein
MNHHYSSNTYTFIYYLKFQNKKNTYSSNNVQIQPPITSNYKFTIDSIFYEDYLDNDSDSDSDNDFFLTDLDDLHLLSFQMPICYCT